MTTQQTNQVKQNNPLHVDSRGLPLTKRERKAHKLARKLRRNGRGKQWKFGE